MRTKLTCLTPLLAAVGAAAAIAAVPTSGATPLPKICLPTDARTTCESSGNVEITNSLPAVTLYPFGSTPYLIGGH
jgi:hypothetical protein